MLAIFGSVSNQIRSRMVSGKIALTKLRSAEKITAREAGHIALFGAGVFTTLYVILAAADLVFVLEATIGLCAGEACEWYIDKSSALVESLYGTFVVTSIIFGIMVVAVACEAFGQAINKRLEA